MSARSAAVGSRRVHTPAILGQTTRTSIDRARRPPQISPDLPPPGSLLIPAKDGHSSTIFIGN